ncbi:MAG TPA: TA system VapC family ribonuclease toxin [Chthoniobacteraceae bacterium]|nr:TA system VapC family ribonuclease toxin [Chthoniobacteraceae bacterium]
MIFSADTNLFLYAANPDSPHHEGALRYFEEETMNGRRFLLCGLVLVELYMQLRNPAVFRKPKSAREAAAFCDALRSNPAWEFGDYEPEVARPLWNWAAGTGTGFRQIIDARLALTLRHHGVTHFATANTKHFEGFGFEKVWNPF